MKWQMLILLLFLTACGGPTNEPPKVSEFRLGYEGVEFEFQPNRPPEQLFEGDAVPVSLEIENRGATHITEDKPVTVTISYDDYYLDFEGRDGPNLAYSGEILGKSIDYPRGQVAEELVIGGLRARNLQGQIESPPTSLFVNICYPYQTVFNTQVCVNSDLYYTDERQQICRTKVISGSGGQGGPISVTSITPRISLIDDTNGLRPVGPNGELVNTAYQVVRPVFEIHIKNSNDGTAYYYGGSDVKDFCKLTSVDRRTQVNKVAVSAFLDPSENNPGTLDCDITNPITNNAVVTLRDGEGIVYCTPPNDQTITAEYNYYAQLTVKLDYIYSEAKTKDFEIVRKQFG